MFNEKPPAERLAISDIGKTVTSSLPDNIASGFPQSDFIAFDFPIGPQIHIESERDFYFLFFFKFLER